MKAQRMPEVAAPSATPAADIPIVDFAGFDGAGTAGDGRIARQLHSAAHEDGFACLVNHGISDLALSAAFAAAREFFAQPDAVKQAVAYREARSNTGYVAVCRESLDPSARPDLKEAFNIADPRAGKARNRWPAYPSGFRAIMERFYEDCAWLANRVLEAFALALQLPQDHFTRRHRERNMILRLLHYPSLPWTDGLSEDQWRAGAHSDYGSITLLFQDDAGGLQVQAPGGQWQAVASVPSGVLINTGDLMQRWTNDVYRSTRHRVALPSPQAARRDRYSIAFFCTPDDATEIRAIESCVSAENPARHPPVTAGEYLLSRLDATY